MGPTGELPAEARLGRGSHALRLVAVERTVDDVALELRVAVRGFAAAAACDVATGVLADWRSDLALLHAALTGRAALTCDGVELVMTGDGRGGVLVEGVLDSETGWGDGERAVLRFTLPTLDQTDLPAVLSLLDAALAPPA